MKKFVYTLIFFGVTLLTGILIFGFDNLDRGIPLLPPVIAIGLALITREVIFSLFLGMWAGAMSLVPGDIHHWYDFLRIPVSGMLRVIDTYMVEGIADKSHAAVILFSLVIGGMVGVIHKSGGLKGLVTSITRVAFKPSRVQHSTFLMGCLIFFDDYANTLIVGNTMRPVSDKMKISREKLSFIIDSTSAPVASISLISTWIGYELGLISDAFKDSGIEIDAYMCFIQSIPYRFYAVLLLVFVILSAFMQRDFGPMLRAEIRARKKGHVLKPGSNPLMKDDLEAEEASHWSVAIIPILTLIFATIAGLVVTGLEQVNSSGIEATFQTVISNADSFASLSWGALTSSIAAILLSIITGSLSFEESMRAWLDGVRSMVLAVIILTMAWGLSTVIKELKTAQLVTELTSLVLTPEILPLVVFITASFISFATGTSWGVMAILFPIIIPLGKNLSQMSGMPEQAMYSIIIMSTGAVLTGAIFGDHCSPISDTTIMSSLASGVDHIDHVATQMPYALFVGFIACIIGYLPAGYGFSPWMSLGIGTILIYASLKLFGRDPAE